MEPDWTDRMLEHWAGRDPRLEREGAQVISRISRIALHLSRWEDDVFGQFGLNRGEVGVLAVLRATGPPHRLSPTHLSRALLLSSAGMTSRLDRLERRGLLSRIPDPDDRRGVLVELTDHGARLADAAVAAIADGQTRVMAGLTAEEIRTLGELLRKLQASIEPAMGTPPA